MRQTALVLAFGVLSALTLASCAAPPAPAPRLVLLYAPCTVNADFLSPYDPSVAFTPRLGEFASEAVVFERHMTEAGQSGPAYASIFSGRHADGHGVFRHPTPIDPAVPLLGEVFRDGGFHVEAWLAQVMASGELGYGRGAHRVYDLMLTADTAEFLQLLAGLRDDRETRALVIANHTLTHAPYRIESLGPFCTRFPAECALRVEDPVRFRAAAGFYLNHHSELSHDFPDVVRRFELNRQQIDYLTLVVRVLYRANVARLDYHFGTLLDAIDEHDLASESLVAFTADHGEALYRDGLLFPWTHGHQLAPEVLRVPLLVRGAGLEPRRYASVSRSTDLLPTLVSLAGLTPPPRPLEPWNGIDLSAAARGDAPELPLEAYSHTALTARVVLEESASWQLFRRWFPREDPALMWLQVRSADVVTQLRGTLITGKDGGESVELVPVQVSLTPPVRSGPRPADAQQLEKLRSYRSRLEAAWIDRTDERAEALGDERQKELLRRLGYIE